MRSDDGVRVFRWLPVSVLPHDRRALGVRSAFAGPATFLSECTHFSPASMSFMPSDSASCALHWLAKSVSPPTLGASSGIEQRAHWRLRHHRGVRVPFLADNPRVAGRAGDGHDLRIVVSCIEIRVDEDLAELPGERLVLLRIQRLVAEEQHPVFGQLAPATPAPCPSETSALDQRQKSQRRTAPDCFFTCTSRPIPGPSRIIS